MTGAEKQSRPCGTSFGCSPDSLVASVCPHWACGQSGGDLCPAQPAAHMGDSLLAARETDIKTHHLLPSLCCKVTLKH